MLDRALNMNSVSVSSVNSHWGHWVKCQQLFSARLGTDIWLYVLQIMVPLLALHCGDYPFWCTASSSCLLGWKWGQCRLAKSIAACHLCVSRLRLLFFFPQSLPLPPLSLLCPSHRAITGIHASTASVCQHDHVSEEGTLRGHGFRCGRTRRHHRSQRWRGGVCDSVYSWTHKPSLVTRLAFNSVSICVCLSGNQTLVSPLYINGSFFLLFDVFFSCSIKPERQTTLITRPLGNKSRHYLFSLSGEDTTWDSMKAICLVVAMMLPNNKEQTLPWRPDHFSKCPVIENSRVIEHITAVGVKDANLKNVYFSGILENILIFTVAQKDKRYDFYSFELVATSYPS